ncbi:NRDE family protein, partial [Longimicrobium sp.]|uniref:NRDE family protein n=1 Tax=Longimicrobium sp. TaxID=2029185 RepID=UPI002E376FBA
MCLIAFAWNAHPAFRLVVAANRDELYDRPAAPADWWTDAPDVLAGRDLREGGTWMGVTRAGRFAAVTNYRDPGLAQRAGAPSRGALVADFLRGSAEAEAYAHDLLARAAAYNVFNLLVGDDGGLFYLSNRAPGVRRLEPGVYGLSNALLDTPWPKVVRAKAALADALRRADGAAADGWESGLWEMLADRVIAADDALPDTGVGMDRERLLSPPFIRSDVYGTRASTVLTLARDGEARLVERSVRP